MIYNFHQFIFLIIAILYLASCGGISSNVVTTSSPTVSAEISNCSTGYTYSPGTTVSGTARFRKRGLAISTAGVNVTSLVLSTVIPTQLPIKYAEIRITDSNSNVVQCGITNSSGQIKAIDGVSILKLPNNAGQFTIQVMSRSNKTFFFASKGVSIPIDISIKEDIYSNTIYDVATTVTSNGSSGTSITAIALVAQGDEALSSSIEGGAFNIYNNWITTAEYIGNNTSSATVSCLSSPLDIYWKAGFNPYQYVYPSANPATLQTVSFYLRGYNELYINGGRVGDVTTQDTDHFDDAVILHEIGHHIESVCGTADSPAGPHSAQDRIDPRLAWSEGFGNFFGGHVIQNNMTEINPHLSAALPSGDWLFYNDTRGYGGTGSDLIRMHLNHNGNSTTYDQVNATLFPAEGHFREGAIARALFKGVNSCTTNCVGDVGFDKYWLALGKTSQGMGVSTSPFRSAVKFFSKLKTANGGSFSVSMSAVLTDQEAMHLVSDADLTVSGENIWPSYGIKLKQSGVACPLNIQPRNTTYTVDDESDQRYSNHFFFFNKPELSAVTSIKIQVSTACNQFSTATNAQTLDLIIFKEGYAYNEDCDNYNSSGDCISVLKTTSSDIATQNRGSYVLNGGFNTKTVTTSSLTNGNYLLNIRAYSSSPKTVNSSANCSYSLVDQSGGFLCPDTTY